MNANVATFPSVVVDAVVVEEVDVFVVDEADDGSVVGVPGPITASDRSES